MIFIANEMKISLKSICVIIKIIHLNNRFLELAIEIGVGFSPPPFTEMVLILRFAGVSSLLFANSQL